MRRNGIGRIALAVFAACGKGKTLESVEVTAQPDKSLYKIDEAFVPTGARLTATYTDKSTKVIEVTEEMCSEVDNRRLEAGDGKLHRKGSDKNCDNDGDGCRRGNFGTIHRGERCGQKYAYSEIQAYAGA